MLDLFIVLSAACFVFIAVTLVALVKKVRDLEKRAPYKRIEKE